MSVQFVCDGCSKMEPGTWVAGHEEYFETERCLVSKDEGGCNKEFERLRFTEGEWKRPMVPAGQFGGGGYWWTREDADGQQHACSRECIEEVAQKLSVTRVVMPW